MRPPRHDANYNEVFTFPRDLVHMRLRHIVLAYLLTTSASAFAADALERVVFTDDAMQTQTVEGRVLVEAQDGGVLLEQADGRLWTVTADRLTSRSKTKQEFQSVTAKELAKQLKAEFGEGFETVRTQHYVICTNAGKVYADWCGNLFERLMAGFQLHWKNSGIPLAEPTMPMTAVVFARRSQYAEFAAKDAGQVIAQSHGYYSVRTNRIVLYDLTATEMSAPARSRSEILRKVALSPFNVATVVHEATHQIAFNSGMHHRYADNPLWLTEGMAMYFETPDLRNRTGWRTVGKVNIARLKRFRNFIQNRRKPGSLASLIQSDKRAANAETATDAYAEAWALTYFLVKRKRKQYEKYLAAIAEKPRLIWDKPEERLKEFQQAFGNDLDKLDTELLRYVARLR